jgi:hypothetical protein
VGIRHVYLHGRDPGCRHGVPERDTVVRETSGIQ